MSSKFASLIIPFGVGISFNLAVSIGAFCVCTGISQDLNSDCNKLFFLTLVQAKVSLPGAADLLITYSTDSDNTSV